MADATTYDLKFSTIQLKEFRHGDITLESPCGIKEIAYKNVSPVIDIQGGGQKSRAKAKRGFCSGRYFLITLCVISLTSLTAIIALSIQLFQVSQQHDETVIRLEKLQREHEHMNSSLSGDTDTKESVVWALREALTRTEEELETTHFDLLKSHEEGKIIHQKLERTIQEKAETANTVKKLRGDLVDTGNKLEEKENELTRCEDNLESVNLQKRNVDQTISHMRNSLSDVQQKLKIKEDILSKKDRELDDTKRTINQVQQSLRDVQEELKKLSNLEERLSDLEEGLSDMEEELSDLKKKLGGAAQCFRKSCEDGRGLELHFGSICPGGWKQIGETCYYFSTENKVRYKAGEDCKKKNATLAKIQESDSILKMMIKKDGRSFWIGLRRTDGAWKWWDGSVQMDFGSSTSEWCAKASPALQSQSCAKLLPWICQKKGRKCRLEEEDLRCVGEKIGVLGEKIQELPLL
ncbi:uncharacterized protein [Aquarana catesbeiana]|uniref:uncharacterized protein n=1 Tax=Aquarana catesbeiana TaxID=8400 RepID=UPI003CCA0F54